MSALIWFLTNWRALPRGYQVIGLVDLAALVLIPAALILAWWPAWKRAGGPAWLTALFSLAPPRRRHRDAPNSRAHEQRDERRRLESIARMRRQVRL